MQSKKGMVDSSKSFDASLVIIECSRTKSDKQDTSNSLRNYITHIVDADIRPVNDQVSFAEVQFTTHHNVLVNEQHHSKQSEPIYDTYLLEKVDSNITFDSTNMWNMRGEIDQNAENDKVFANVALKNKLRKLKGNGVDTKFAKPSILGKPVLQPPKSQSVVRKPNTFKSERASQVNVNNVLPKPITPHYMPKVKEYVLAKPHHVIAPGSSRNSQEESYGSNDIAYNHYLEEAKKKTQETNRNSKPRVMHTISPPNTNNDSKQKPRSNNQTSKSLPVTKSSGVMSNSVPLLDYYRNSSSFLDSKHFVCLTGQKCVFNANHDDCITKFLKEVNSCAKFLQSMLQYMPIQPVYLPQLQLIKMHHLQRFSKGVVDPTLFTRKEGKDILLVQIYVDDIIFASTDPALYPDHDGCQDTKRSTSSSMQLLGDRLREAMEASKRRRSMIYYRIQQLSKGLSKGSGIIPEVLNEPKDNYGCSSSSLFGSDDEVQDVSSDEENKADAKV
nr:retrovirus-related Pol polyprotein from transposon TNT 1-94 [Tanacetum cinerariifolium]